MGTYTRREYLRLLASGVIAAGAAALPLQLAGAEVTAGVPVLKKSDRCPVCGMFVYKYPKWVAQIVFKDGASYFYDGAKDMYKHYFDVAKYTPGKVQSDITHLYVTDYYEVELIEAKTAYYVLGSNILGPMGHELLPFKDQESAQEFLEDHKGKSIIRFPQITPPLLISLDRRG
jgi:nitrous oxide reductase accessory protein NosL